MITNFSAARKTGEHNIALIALHQATWDAPSLGATLNDVHVGEPLVLKGLRRDRAIAPIEHVVFRYRMTLNFKHRLGQEPARV